MSHTVIPAHATVDGLIDTPGDVTIEGRVEGEVRAGGTVTIAAGATCKASVLSGAALIYGELIGNAVCTETIEVAQGARVVGNLRAPNVAVAAHCEVDGRVDLLPPEPQTPTMEVSFRRSLPRMPRPVGRVRMAQRTR